MEEEGRGRQERRGEANPLAKVWLRACAFDSDKTRTIQYS